MQVISKCDAVLTNFEVADLLARQQQQRLDEEAALPLPGARRTQAGSTAWSSQQSLAGISEQVMSYLERSPCAGQSRENILAFQQAITPFKLTRMEALALVNTPPNSLVEVHLLVEECEERLKGDEIWALLNLCRRLLLDAPVDQPVDMEASGMDGADGEYGTAL